MQHSSTAVSTQHLAEFLAVVSAAPDVAAAIRAAVERAARVLEAEVAAVLTGTGVAAAVGFLDGRVPADDLVEVVAGGRSHLDVPGAGVCRAVAVAVGRQEASYLLVARSRGDEADDDGFTVDEMSLIRGMSRVLELTLETLSTLEAERRAAAENARLVASLRERQRLLEHLSTIQRAIARRAPLEHILNAITAGARELLDDEVACLWLVDPDEQSMLLLVSQHGMRDEAAAQLWRMPLRDAGAAGLATQQDRLVVMEHYGTAPHSVRVAGEQSIQAAMAAPVHDSGTAVGALVVASYRDDRIHSEADQQILLAFAEHVSLAVTDANTLEAMHQAFHDSLTGLASRALFLDRVTHALACAAGLAVLFIDLDRFKVVNDSLGHSAGDTLLIQVAERLRGCLRAGDTAARLGGDEFAVLLQDIGSACEATAVANRIIEVLRAPFLINSKEVFIGSSVGVAMSSPGRHEAETLVQCADLAMYQAKKAGRGRYQVFEPAMHTARQNSIELEAHLRGALDLEQFELWYQPVVELVSGRITAVEALLRWRHPERGVVLPADFIPLAEDTGLILPMGRWALREACRQVSEWNRLRGPAEPLVVSVNLSARQLQQPDLPATIEQALLDSGLNPCELVLEITESLLLHDTDAVIARLRDLKALGVQLALDDFGTGYSSLAYLRRFPVDILKIDKSFLDEVSPEATALTRAIVNLGHTLRLATVAEGIETAEQSAEVRGSGCQYGQGFYFAKPLVPEELEPLLMVVRNDARVS